MSTSKARELLWPTDPKILLRFVFLYVGQGSSTVVLVRDGDSYRSILVDINLDSRYCGVNVPELISDLLDGEKLDVFVNTHPHNDHLKGLIELSEKVEIGEVWHSGHKPGKKHDDAYKDLEKVMKKVKDAGRNVIQLERSRHEKSIGDGRYYTLAPAEYVSEDIADEDQETRYRCIHEQCAVLKFGTGGTWVMLPGDADRDAFEKHITQYHGERLNAVLLAASHHGSRTFFRYAEEDKPYLEARDAINPEYVIMSAPRQEESEHGHPHDDAVELYKKSVGEQGVLHTGDNRYSFISDIRDDGSYSGIRDDKGELANLYPIGGGKRTPVAPLIIGTRVDDRPMGS